MKTTESNETETSENGESQNDQNNESNQNDQNQQTKEAGPRTMFLEYDRWKPGQHNISAIIKDPGEKRGQVSARIFTEFSPDKKGATYTAKDAEGNILFSSPKLWEVKKNIKENSKILLEQARLAKKNAPVIGAPQKKEEPLAKKEFKAMGEKLLSEAGHFTDSAVQATTGIDRQGDLKKIRHKKLQKNRGLQR